ncbi:MAG: MalY/PatB family protein [Gammaproteobacteria bacterium]
MVAGIDDLQLSALRCRHGEKWSHYEADVIPAWVADMDFELAAPIREAIIGRVSSFDCGYPVAAHDTGLPQIFADRVAKKFNWQINPSQVDLFNDVVQGIFFGLLTLCGEQDGVLIQTPIYPPFLSSVEETKRRTITSPLIQGKERFEIDFDHLEDQIKMHKPRVFLFCNPHNPSGRCFTRDELEKLSELVLKHEMYVISDEIHADLILDDSPHIPFASINDKVATRTVTLMSASKAFNMAGVCMAFAVFGGSEVKKLYRKVPRHLRGALSALSVAGVSAALTQGESWLTNVLARLRENRDTIVAHTNRHWPHITYLPTQATYLAWLDCRNLKSELDISITPYEFFLKNARVALSDGARFGEPGVDFARLNFATSKDILDEILARMDKALATHSL